MLLDVRLLSFLGPDGSKGARFFCALSIPPGVSVATETGGVCETPSRAADAVLDAAVRSLFAGVERHFERLRHFLLGRLTTYFVLQV